MAATNISDSCNYKYSNVATTNNNIINYNNNNNNNNRICIAQVCQMNSEALDGQLQSCYAARARGLNVRRKRNVFRLRLNRARELQHKVSVFREFQTAGADKLYIYIYILTELCNKFTYLLTYLL